MSEGGAGATLSGKKVRLISESGSTFEIAREVAEQSEFVKAALDDDAEEDDSEEEDEGDDSPEVPVRAVNDVCLAKAIAFMQYHRTTPYTKVDKPISSNNLDSLYTDDFDKEFVSKDVVTTQVKEADKATTASLQDLIRTAEFLQIPDMLELCVVKAATLIKDHTPEEIDEAFGIEGELTPAEEARVFAENPWLKEE